MKTILESKLFLVACLASTLSFSACDDWTEVESLDMHSSSLEEQNSQLYNDYLQDLRNFKAADHKITLVSFDNPLGEPLKQGERLTVLPDSLDFVNLNNADNLSSGIQEEMVKVRNDKGTRFVYTISYDKFESDWNAKVKEEENETFTEEDALEFIGKCTDDALAICDKFGYDGIIVEYTGLSLVSMTEDMLKQYNVRQQNFFNRIMEWKKAHQEKALMLYGNVQYLVPENMPMLAEYNAIILKTLNSTNAEDVTLKAYMAVQAGQDAVAGNEGMVNPVPADRFIACVETPRLEDKEQTHGYWNTMTEGGEKTLASYGAARWAISSSVDIVRKGIYILNAHNDYYDNAVVYQHVRESIFIMNPNK